MTNFMRKLSTTAAAIGLAFGSAACAQDAPTVETATQAAPAGPALWKVSDEDTTIYLFGTVHVLRPDTDWYKPYVANALVESGEIVTEVDMTQMAAAAPAMVSAATLPEGTTLRGLMDDENRAEYEAALATMGLPAAALDQFEPWFAAMNLQIIPLMAAGFDPAAGVDQLVLARADAAAKRSALETVQLQIDVFDKLPQDSQLTYLDETSEGIDEIVPMIDALVDEWLAGDAVGLAEMMNEGLTDPALYAALLTNRNVAWADWIEERLNTPGTVFIAVGAGHLAGDDSVQNKLQTLGIATERVN